ncbi:biliverdin-producing heme oxygenase [Promicromonospora sukumoe]|uniref:Heme oxygenase n=1 Tax=Promicromonospora sukumoe TaxID=88382 RepID=A0A7W3PES9_9MICO|nr:biliverdin-producing heme oxygenase [Promicromonospora sukumoe]MBA8809188.1 heme oxygenase [Promicromonospora sukumoe]
MSLPVEETAPVPLSALLRERTRAAHGEANSEQFIEELLSGGLSRAAHADLSAQLLPVYEALEEASAALGDDDRGAGLVFTELARVPALERDLAFLYGPAWRDEIRILPATHAYADHIREVGGSLPHYAAHSYTRYLGDLSGGQIVKRMMKQHYGLEEEGVAFYTFPDIPKVKVFKDAYRDALDQLDLDDDEVTATLDETLLAFTLNRAVFTELAEIHC